MKESTLRNANPDARANFLANLNEIPLTGEQRPPLYGNALEPEPFTTAQGESK